MPAGRVLFYDDIEVGSVVEGQGHYVLERAEILDFARKWDPQPFHVDEAAARRSIFGELTASGVHLLAIRSWLMHHMGVGIAIVASLGTDESRILAPVHAGDRLSLRLEWVSKRESKSRPQLGVVSMRSEVRNQAEAPVLTAVERILVRRRRGT